MINYGKLLVYFSAVIFAVAGLAYGAQGDYRRSAYFLLAALMNLVIIN